MESRHDIPNLHWQLATQPGPSASWHQIERALGDLHQSIRNLVLTPKGSVPLQPEKGCDLLPWIDRHASEAIPYLVREVWQGLARWEPRIVLDKVDPRPPALAAPLVLGHWSFAILWRPTESVLQELQLTEVDYVR